jgi:glycosyltransferase involved in cell wall biosynthesis
MPAQRGCDVLAVILDVALMLENSAVFQSQVVDQLVALRRLGYEVGVLAVSRDPAAFERTAGERLRATDVQVFLVRDRGFARNLVAMAAALRKLRRTHAIGVAYVRGVWGPLVLALARSFRRIRYVYDVRGALADETGAVGRARIKQRIYSALERWSIERATRVSAVTHALAQNISHVHRIPAVEVVPCCVNLDDMTVSPPISAARRRELGYAQSDIVLLYSGGLSHYQQVPAMLALWRRLRDEQDVRFLMLTNDDPHSAPAVVGDLRDFGDRLRHLSLPRSQIAATLAAADVGFMLRDARELNRVASPVKFAEYLAAGLAIVASPGTGDASELIVQRRLGALVDPARLDEGEQQVRALLRMLRAEREQQRSRARALAAERYDWHAHRSAFQRLYGLPHALVESK